MPRIVGIEIPENKQIIVSLTYIHGIGLALSKKVLKEANISPDKKTKDLNSEEINRLKEIRG